MQAKKHSILEAIVNTLVGFIVTMTFGPLIYWCCGMKPSLGQMTLATILFTILSIVRNYVIRRFFNKKTVQIYEQNKS